VLACQSGAALAAYNDLKCLSRMNVNLHEEKCKAALDGLATWVYNLISLSNEIIQGVKYRDDDHFGFMGLCFLSRQIDHLQCMIILVPHRDMMLIARSMIEGLCMVKWASLSGHNRPLMWRTFGYVHDWRILALKVAAGEVIDPDQQTRIESGLAKYGHLLYTRAARSAIREGRELPNDPYHRHWTCGTQIKQICESVGGRDLHGKIYSTYSDWHHWGTSTMAESLSFSEDRVLHESSSMSKSAMALVTGFQCLIETVEVINQHLDLGRESEITAIHDEFVKWHTDRGHLVESAAPSA
jgi:hypothetical protein